MHILSSTSIPYTLTTVQVPNLALTHMKRITVRKKKQFIRMDWRHVKEDQELIISSVLYFKFNIFASFTKCNVLKSNGSNAFYSTWNSTHLIKSAINLLTGFDSVKIHT
jgi:hypothetical protein